MTKKLKIITRNGEITMAIELKIGTRGTRRDITGTFNEYYLKANGIFCLNELELPLAFAVRTKYGLMCSLSGDDIVTYMGAGIWDLRPKHKPEEYY